jgi:hypothetical protein
MLFALVACLVDPSHQDPIATEAGMVRPGDDGAVAAEDASTWTFLVYMNGDNDLESYVIHDLNELEVVGSSPGVNVVVQADRIDGYDERGGNWTGGRRYFVRTDRMAAKVTSPVLEEMGEIDMGDPATLTDFLFWAEENYPADRVALILWNHGTGWTVAPIEPTEAISYDDSSGNSISIAEGELAGALEPYVDAHGPIDVIGFDACNMATFEVAHALRPWANVLVGSQSTVGWEGFQYADALGYLRDGGGDGAGLADLMAATEVAKGGEWNASATDLGRITPLADALDALALTALEAPSRIRAVMRAREDARAVQMRYHDWYVDLGDFADVLATSGDETLGAAAADVRAMLDPAVIGTYGNEDYEWVSGLSIHLATKPPRELEAYQDGAGATWSQETHWDELLWAIDEMEAE